jgi:hypothetical protein
LAIDEAIAMVIIIDMNVTSLEKNKTSSRQEEVSNKRNTLLIFQASCLLDVAQHS